MWENTLINVMLIILNTLFAVNGAIVPNTKVGKGIGFIILFTVFPTFFVIMSVFVDLTEKTGNDWLIIPGAVCPTAVLLGLCWLAGWVSSLFDKKA